jgi:hypothetical protein
MNHGFDSRTRYFSGFWQIANYYPSWLGRIFIYIICEWAITNPDKVFASYAFRTNLEKIIGSPPSADECILAGSIKTTREINGPPLIH